MLRVSIVQSTTILNMKQTQSVDLSNQPDGIFILVTDDKKTLK